MRRYVFIGLTLLVGLLFHHRTHAQIIDPLRQGHALLIGNSHYRDAGWSSLDDIPLQLDALKKGLENHFDTVEVVQNLETEQLRQKINSFLRTYGNERNARLFLYYAGHGYTEEILERNENRGYITGIDTPWHKGAADGYNAARRLAISMQEIKGPIAEVLAQHILFVFDSCFAGTIFTSRAGDEPPKVFTPDVVTRVFEKLSREFITTGSANERVPAHSPLPELFLAALNGEADRYQQGVISAADIGAFLRARIGNLRELKLTPQQGRLPDAAFAEGAFLFRVVKQAGVMPWLGPSAKLTKSDVIKLFTPFKLVLERVRSNYIEEPDEKKLLLAALRAMQTTFTPTQTSAIGGKLSELISNATGRGDPTKIDLNALHDAALQMLNTHRPDGGDQRLVTAAINGMLAELDPRSSYIDAKSYISQARTRALPSVGIEVTKREDGLIKVIAPIDETPAQKAGILAQDVISHVDDEPVQELNLDQVVEKMHGPLNTKIKLRIIHPGEGKPIELTVTRDVIRVPSVRSWLDRDDVGIIRIAHFNERTTDDLKSAITTLFSKAGDKLKGFVLDLRNTPGQAPYQAVSVSAALINPAILPDAATRKFVIMYSQERPANYELARDVQNIASNKPMIVLINDGSADASEIVAGALQDWRRATFIGTRTFGKGSYQQIIPLGNDYGALSLPTALYLTPLKYQFEGKGIAPDLDLDDRYYASKKPLELALDLIRGIQHNSAYPPNPRVKPPR